MQRTIILNTPPVVPASGVAVFDLNNLLGTCLESLNLDLGGGAFTKAMITGLILKANNKIIWESDGAKHNTQELFKGYLTTDDTARLCINFMEQKARTPMAFQAGAIDLSPSSGITNLKLEVTIAGATTPTLGGVAEVSAINTDPTEANIRYLFKRRHRAPQTIGAAGKFALIVPHMDPAGGGSLFQRIGIFTANYTAVQLMWNGSVQLDMTKAQIEFIQKKAGRTPQAGFLCLDFLLDNIQSGRLFDTTPGAGCQSAQVYITLSAGETVTVETEELLGLNAY